MKRNLTPADHTNVVWPMSRNHYNHLSSNENQTNVRLSLYLQKFTHALNLTSNHYIVCMHKNKYHFLGRILRIILKDILQILHLRMYVIALLSKLSFAQSIGSDFWDV